MTVYKKLSEDMRQGLRDIYRQISQASAEGEPHEQTDALFNEASTQLNEVMKDTESAAMRIMGIVESELDRSEETRSLLQKARGADAQGLAAILERLEKMDSDRQANLTDVLTALSFQDITGQRIKKAVQALRAIENSVVELYLSSGLVLAGAEKNPEKSGEALRAEANEAVENLREKRALKGPDRSVTQANIDDMLAQLGL